MFVKTKPGNRTLETFLTLLLLLACVHSLPAQGDSTTVKLFDDVIFPEGEKHYRQILSLHPDNIEAHEAIVEYYWEGYNSIPIMALTMLNIIDPESKDAKKRIKAIRFLYRRYLTLSKEGTTVHVAPKFVADWDAGYENNVSPLEAGFTAAGAIDYAPEEKYLNSSERMVKKFDLVFSAVPNFRSRYHGIYWDLYVDYFTKLHQSDHFRTAMYIVMATTNEREITKWLKDNPDRIEAFRRWHTRNLSPESSTEVLEVD